MGQNPNAITKLALPTLWNSVTVSSVTKRQFGATDTALPTSGSYATTLSAAGLCQNAVMEVHYMIVHSDDGVMSSVQAAVVLADVQASNVAVRQSFSVAYAGKTGNRCVDERHRLAYPMISPNSYPSPLNPPSPPLRPRSGNPGYIAGLPLLVGRMQEESTKRAITERVGGLKLFGPSADGTCSTTVSTPVAFHEDLRVGCTKKLNYAELKDLCETSQQNQIPAQLNVTDDFVGILGNSDPNRVEEWLKIGGKWNDGLGSLPTFTAETGVCKGLVVGLEYRVLYANIGAKTNPQRKVLAVTASYKLDTWHFMLENVVRMLPLLLHLWVPHY